MERTHFAKSEALNMHVIQNTISNSKQIVKENEHPEWLPDGWKVDVKIRKSGAHMGAVYKCYVDPSSGSKFYSKPEVLRYLETLKGNNCTFNKGSGYTVANSAVVEESTVEDLPSGWIKEVKMTKTGNGIQNNPQSAAKKQKSNQSASRQQLFAGNKIYDEGSSELLDADSSKKGQHVKVPAETIVASVSAGETVVKMHSLEDAAASLPEIKEKSDPADMQGKNYVVNVMENANANNHNNHSASSNKKQLIVPHRYSKRLAGIETNLAANAGAFKPDLQVLKGKLRESRITLEADMENKSSQQLCVVPEFELGHKDFMDASRGESLNKCNNLSEGQVSRKPAHRLAKEKISDNKPEHQHFPAQDSSSPSPNVSIKTVTDELAALDNPHDSHGLASETTVCKDNELHMSSIGKSGYKIRANLNKSSNKKGHHVPSRVSKRLAGFEPELKANSIYCDKAPEYRNRKSKSKVNVVAPQSEDGPATELADPASTNMRAPINGESSNERSPEIPAITAEQQEQEKVGDEKMNGEKSEQLSFAFQYSWSDPCLEFAIKTLTGVLTVEDTVDNGPTLVPETDAIKKTSFESGNTNPQVSLKKSKNKKDLRLPRRLSKRLAGHEPELLATERALEYAARKPNKAKPTTTVTLSNGAQHFDAGEERDCTLAASDSSKTTALAESSNKTEKSEEAQTAPGKQLQELEAEKIGDEELKPQFLLQFEDSWSDDPCLEFAIRTLTGALPEDAAMDIDAPQNKELPERAVEESINIKDLDNLMQSKCMNELGMACQTSDELVGQPELRTISTPCENAPKFANSNEASITGNLEQGEAIHIEAGNVTQLANESRNINTLFGDKPSKKAEQVLGGEAVPAMLRQLETQAMNYEKPESQFCAPFIDSWSDPCLEFAFRTLTSELPVDENLAIPECLLEPSQWNNRSMLPDFGSPSFSESVITSPHSDLGEKSMPGQQSPMGSFLPLHGYAAVDSQKPYSQGNNFKERMYFP